MGMRDGGKFDGRLLVLNIPPTETKVWFPTEMVMIRNLTNSLAEIRSRKLNKQSSTKINKRSQGVVILVPAVDIVSLLAE